MLTQATIQDELQQLLASDPPTMGRAYDVWTRLRDEAPVLRLGSTVVVTRYEHAKFMLKDLDHFRTPTFADYGNRVAEELTPTNGDQWRSDFFAVGQFEQHYMNRSGDGEKHDRLRRIAHRYFTPARIAEMEDTIARYADELLDDAVRNTEEDGVTDLMPFAYRLPLMVICDMLGVPPEDRELVHGWSSRLGRNRMGREPEPLRDAHLAMGEFRDYVEKILWRHRADPQSVSALVASLMDAEESERLSEDELTAMFVILLFAGHETTTNLIGNGTLALMSHRDQWARLTADTSIARDATEELLRFVAPVQWLTREITREIDLDGTRAMPGETIMAPLAVANRDPRVFPNPDTLDLTRPEARNHLSLGFGIHFCLGQALARLEGKVVFERLACRYPGLELAVDPDDLAWQGHAMLRSLSSLPVRLGAAPTAES